MNLITPLKQRVRLSWKPWTMWSLGALFYAYESILQVSNGVMANVLMHDFHITAAKLSQMSSLYFLAYGLVQIPIGLLLDRFGVRRPIILALLLCITGIVIFSHAEQFQMAGLGRLLIGLGSSFAALSCLQLAALWFPACRFAFLTGLLLTIGMCGQLMGEAPLALWLHYSSWQSIMGTFTLIGICLLLLLIVGIEDKPTTHHHKSSNMMALTPKCLTVIRSYPSWCLALYGMLMYTPFLIFSTLWGIPFLVTAAGVSQTQAAGILSWMLIGFACGAPILGWLADRTQKKQYVLAVSSFIYCIALCILLYLPHQAIWLSSVLLCVAGFFCSGFLPAFSIMKDIHSPDIRATALGFMNSLNMLGAWIVLPIVGLLLDRFWQHQWLNGIRIYDLHSYQLALSTCPLMIILAGCMLLMIPKMKQQ